MLTGTTKFTPQLLPRKAVAPLTAKVQNCSNTEAGNEQARNPTTPQKIE